jgi:hypothetical protein
MVMQSLSEGQIHQIGTGQEEVVALPVGQAAPVSSMFDKLQDIEAPEVCVSPPANEPVHSYSRRETSNALDYIRRIKDKSRSHESRYAELIRTLEALTAGQRIYRKSKNEWWATVKVTEDMEIRVRGLDEKDIGQLERLADLLRHLLMKGV